MLLSDEGFSFKLDVGVVVWNTDEPEFKPWLSNVIPKQVEFDSVGDGCPIAIKGNDLKSSPIKVGDVRDDVGDDVGDIGDLGLTKSGQRSSSKQVVSFLHIIGYIVDIDVDKDVDEDVGVSLMILYLHFIPPILFNCRLFLTRYARLLRSFFVVSSLFPFTRLHSFAKRCGSTM